MAEIALYEGDEVTLFWGGMAHRCRVYPSHQRCGMCGGMTIHLEPGWDTWTLLCTKETALTTTQEDREAAERTLPPNAIGLVSLIPVRMTKGWA
jgi:hypothetical protein